jgi:hypothetical protein
MRDRSGELEVRVLDDADDVATGIAHGGGADPIDDAVDLSDVSPAAAATRHGDQQQLSGGLAIARIPPMTRKARTRISRAAITNFVFVSMDERMMHKPVVHLVLTA